MMTLLYAFIFFRSHALRTAVTAAPALCLNTLLLKCGLPLIPMTFTLFPLFLIRLTLKN
jgi:hypothetical protein